LKASSLQILGSESILQNGAEHTTVIDAIRPFRSEAHPAKELVPPGWSQGSSKKTVCFFVAEKQPTSIAIG
jgi:hypothetical protein